MKSSMTKRALLLLGGCLGVAAVGYRSGKHPALPPADDTGTATSASAASSHACAFPTGTTMSYALRVSTEGKLATGEPGDSSSPDLQIMAGLGGGAPGGLTGGDQAQVHTTAVQLDLKALPAGEHGGAAGSNVLLARLRDLDNVTAGMTGDLSPPFLLRVDAACTITDFARLDSAPVAAARTQQALAHELQWTMPQGRAQIGAGANSLGAFVADFAQGRDQMGAFVTRRIDRYTRLWNRMGARRGGADAPTVSHKRVSLDEGPWFKSIEGLESSRDLSIIAATTQTVVVRAATPPNAFAGAPTAPGRYIWDDLLPKSVAPPPRPVAATISAAERKALAQTTLDRQLRSFNALTDSGANMKDTWPPLARLLEVRPELAKPLADKLVSGQIPPGSTAGVYVALSNAKVPEARDALLGINRNPARHMMDRSRAAFALVSRADVGVALARDLRQDSHAITTGADRPARIYAREAALALGMMGGLKGDTQPEIKQEVVGAINDVLRAGQQWHDLRPAFAMMANLGDAQMLGIAEPYTRAPDAKIRQATTIAIRRMKPLDSERFTLDWLQRETDPDVKRRLYTTLQMQVFDAREVASDRLLAQAVVDLKANPPQQMLTRQAILRTIKDVVEANPTKLEGLRQVLRDQLSFELRAQSGLADLISPMLGAGDIALAARAIDDGLRQGPGIDNAVAVPARTGPEAQ